MHTNELLQHSEQPQPRTSRGGGTESALTSARVQDIITTRVTMLDSIERYLSSALNHALREKIEFEKKTLTAIIASEDRAIATARKSTAILHRSFFEVQTLDTSLID